MLLRLNYLFSLVKFKNYSRAMCDDSVYQAGTLSACFVTAPDETIAKELAHKIISNKLAACVNLIPRITSIYMWEGNVTEDQEILMMIKTKTTRVGDLAEFVRANHPYSVAEVISLPIENGNSPYLKWVQESVPESSK